MTLSSAEREEGAAIAFKAAMACCERTGNRWSCRGYHALWQYLRFTGIQPSISRDADVLLALLDHALVNVAKPKILISGAADYGLLELVFDWTNKTGKKVAVDVIDQCSTPLRANEWYGEKKGMKLGTHLCDIRGFSPPEPYDLVTTHSFLAMFALKERQGIFDKWNQLLRPEGWLMTSSRVYNVVAASKRESPDVNEVTSRLECLLSQLHAMGWSEPCESSRLHDLLRELFVQRPTNEIVIESELQEMLRVSGFEMIRCVNNEAAAPGVDSLVGAPKDLSESRRVTFLARKK